MPPLPQIPFNLTVSSCSSHPRVDRRIFVPANILIQHSLHAGDPLALRIAVDISRSLSISSSSTKSTPLIAIGVACPSFTLPPNSISASPTLAENANISSGDIVSISPLPETAIFPAGSISIRLISPTHPSSSTKEPRFAKYVKESLLEVKYVIQGHKIHPHYNGAPHTFIVESASSETSASKSTSQGPSLATKIFSVSDDTNVNIILSPPSSPTDSTVLKREPADKAYAMIGGLDSQIEQIRELVELPLTRPELFAKYNLKTPRGILLHGPPGTGKTLLASIVARSLGLRSFPIAGHSVSSPFHGETEAALKKVFDEAAENSPSVIVIDEIDALCPRREDGGEVEKRVVATLLMLMDGLESKITSLEESPANKPAMGGVVVIAATNRPNALDPALRRPGRFDREIEIGVPDVDARSSILSVLIRNVPHQLSDASLRDVSSRTHGYVGADLSALVHAAGLRALKRTISNNSTENEPLNSEDFEVAMTMTRPSAMREVFVEVPKVRWVDVGGQKEVKQRLCECVEWPLRHPEAFARLGVKAPRGVLLYGPPGCSKTMIARALATEAGINFISVRGAEIFDKYVGESERAIRETFRKARTAAPSIVFMDEIDAIASSRDEAGSHSTTDRVLTTLLLEMDGVEELRGVMILAATNRPQVIDPALMRPGRLDRLLYVGPPDFDSRVAILTSHISNMAVDRVDVEELAALTEGCSGVEVVSVCQDAALRAMNEDLSTTCVKSHHFVEAAQAIKRRITPEMLAMYEAWRDQISFA